MNTFYLRRFESLARKFSLNQSLESLQIANASSLFAPRSFSKKSVYNFNVFYLKNTIKPTHAAQKTLHNLSSPSFFSRDSIFESHYEEIVDHLKNSSPENNSFFFLNRWEVKALADSFKSQFPNVTPYYSVRNNPIESMVSAALECGICMSCDSQREFEIVQKVQSRHYDFINAIKNKSTSSGASHSYQVHFSNPVKQECELEAVITTDVHNQVQYFYADSMEELGKISQSSSTAQKLLWCFHFKKSNILSEADALQGGFGKNLGEDVERPDQAKKRFNAIQQQGHKVSGLKITCNPQLTDQSSFLTFVSHALAEAEIAGNRIETVNFDGSDLFAMDVTQGDIDELIQGFAVQVTVTLPENYFAGAGCGVFRVLKKTESRVPRKLSFTENFMKTLNNKFQMSFLENNATQEYVVAAQQMILPENLYSSFSKKIQSNYVAQQKNFSKEAEKTLIPTSVLTAGGQQNVLSDILLPETLSQSDFIALSHFNAGFYYRQDEQSENQLDVVFLNQKSEKQKDLKEISSAEEQIEVETI